jgi:15-cis-phytoene synthase
MSLTAAASGTAASSLEESRRYCASLTRQEARNFYYGLKLLPQSKRHAMFALYAYMRLVDDIADGDDGQTVAHRREALDAWAEATQVALSGRPQRDAQPIWPAFAEMVQEHNVPHRVFYDVIAGQRQDLDSPGFQTFEHLRQYCYRVAGVVGIASIYIWGFEGGPKTESLAIDRGIAFQLTNILRDLREDAGRGRVYLPRCELDAAGIDESLLRGGEPTESFCSLMRDQIARADAFYRQSAALESLISSDSRPTLSAMTQIYHGLLEKMRADPGCVLRQRVRLSPMTKFRIAWRATRSR